MTPSDHVTFQGPVPVSAADRVAEPPMQMLWLPETVAVGNWMTVMVAEPVPVFEQLGVVPFWVTLVTVKVVVLVGAMLRVAGLVATPTCIPPSDHVTSQGPVPVSAALMVVN